MTHYYVFCEELGLHTLDTKILAPKSWPVTSGGANGSNNSLSPALFDLLS